LDRSALEKLVEENGRKLFNTVYYMLGDYQAAEDVVQDVFVRAFTGLHKFRHDASVSTWLYRIAMNAVSDYMKKNSRDYSTGALNDADREILTKAAATAAPEDEAMRRQLNTALRNCLDTLQPEHRAVLILKEINGYSYKEIAGIMNTSIGTVESRLFRAREAMRKNFVTTRLNAGDCYESL